jgi:hypothetical protein
VHYAFGASMGAIYGAYSQRHKPERSGAAFGTTVWLAADEIAMPVLGLSNSTATRPFEMHLQSLVAHLVYGATTEALIPFTVRQIAKAGALFPNALVRAFTAINSALPGPVRTARSSAPRSAPGPLLVLRSG